MELSHQRSFGCGPWGAEADDVTDVFPEFIKSAFVFTTFLISLTSIAVNWSPVFLSVNVILGILTKMHW